LRERHTGGTHLAKERIRFVMNKTLSGLTESGGGSATRRLCPARGIALLSS
jgi:hypothetical protein